MNAKVQPLLPEAFLHTKYEHGMYCFPFVSACIVRYNGLSLMYLICLLIIPLLPSPSRRAGKQFSVYFSRDP